MKANPLVGFTLENNNTVCLACATKEEYDTHTEDIMLLDVEDKQVICTRCGLSLPGSKDNENS